MSRPPQQPILSEARPTIISPPSVAPIFLRFGSSASVTVHIFGQPEPDVTWYIGRRIIDANDAQYWTETDFEKHRHTFRVRSVGAELDAGIVVVASNTHGMDRRTLDITTYKVHKSGSKKTNPESTTSSTTSIPRSSKAASSSTASSKSVLSISNVMNGSTIEPRKVRKASEKKKSMNYLRDSGVFEGRSGSSVASAADLSRQTLSSTDDVFNETQQNRNPIPAPPLQQPTSAPIHFQQAPVNSKPTSVLTSSTARSILFPVRVTTSEFHDNCVEAPTAGKKIKKKKKKNIVVETENETKWEIGSGPGPGSGPGSGSGPGGGNGPEVGPEGGIICEATKSRLKNRTRKLKAENKNEVAKEESAWMLNGVNLSDICRKILERNFPSIDPEDCYKKLDFDKLTSKDGSNSSLKSENNGISGNSLKTNELAQDQTSLDADRGCSDVHIVEDTLASEVPTVKPRKTKKVKSRKTKQVSAEDLEIGGSEKGRSNNQGFDGEDRAPVVDGVEHRRKLKESGVFISKLSPRGSAKAQMEIVGTSDRTSKFPNAMPDSKSSMDQTVELGSIRAPVSDDNVTSLHVTPDDAGESLVCMPVLYCHLAKQPENVKPKKETLENEVGETKSGLENNVTADELTGCHGTETSMDVILHSDKTSFDRRRHGSEKHNDVTLISADNPMSCSTAEREELRKDEVVKESSAPSLAWNDSKGNPSPKVKHTSTRSLKHSRKKVGSNEFFVVDIDLNQTVESGGVESWRDEHSRRGGDMTNRVRGRAATKSNTMPDRSASKRMKSYTMPNASRKEMLSLSDLLSSRSQSTDRISRSDWNYLKERTRSVEISVPRRSRSASKLGLKSLSREWKVVTITTTTDETRIPSATGSETRISSATGSETRIPSATGSDTRIPSATGSEMKIPSATGSETRIPSAIGSETKIPSTTGSETRIPSATGSETRIPSATGSETRISSATESETKITSATGNETRIPSAAGSETRIPLATGRETRIASATGSETRIPSTIGSKTRVPSATGSDTSTSSVIVSDRQTGSELNDVTHKVLRSKVDVPERTEEDTLCLDGDAWQGEVDGRNDSDGRNRGRSTDERFVETQDGVSGEEMNPREGTRDPHGSSELSDVFTIKTVEKGIVYTELETNILYSGLKPEPNLDFNPLPNDKQVLCRHIKGVETSEIDPPSPFIICSDSVEIDTGGFVNNHGAFNLLPADSRHPPDAFDVSAGSRSIQLMCSEMPSSRLTSLADDETDFKFENEKYEFETFAKQNINTQVSLNDFNANLKSCGSNSSNFRTSEFDSPELNARDLHVPTCLRPLASVETSDITIVSIALRNILKTETNPCPNAPLEISSMEASAVGELKSGLNNETGEDETTNADDDTNETGVAGDNSTSTSAPMESNKRQGGMETFDVRSGGNNNLRIGIIPADSSLEKNKTENHESRSHAAMEERVEDESESLDSTRGGFDVYGGGRKYVSIDHSKEIDETIWYTGYPEEESVLDTCNPGEESVMDKCDPGEESGLDKCDPGEKSVLDKCDPEEESVLEKCDPGEESVLDKCDPGEESILDECDPRDRWLENYCDPIEESSPDNVDPEESNRTDRRLNDEEFAHESTDDELSSTESSTEGATGWRETFAIEGAIGRPKTIAIESPTGWQRNEEEPGTSDVIMSHLTEVRGIGKPASGMTDQSCACSGRLDNDADASSSDEDSSTLGYSDAGDVDGVKKHQWRGDDSGESCSDAELRGDKSGESFRDTESTANRDYIRNVNVIDDTHDIRNYVQDIHDNYDNRDSSDNLHNSDNRDNSDNLDSSDNLHNSEHSVIEKTHNPHFEKTGAVDLDNRTVNRHDLYNDMFPCDTNCVLPEACHSSKDALTTNFTTSVSLDQFVDELSSDDFTQTVTMDDIAEGKYVLDDVTVNTGAPEDCVTQMNRDNIDAEIFDDSAVEMNMSDDNELQTVKIDDIVTTNNILIDDNVIEVDQHLMGDDVIRTDSLECPETGRLDGSVVDMDTRCDAIGGINRSDNIVNLEEFSVCDIISFPARYDGTGDSTDDPFTGEDSTKDNESGRIMEGGSVIMELALDVRNREMLSEGKLHSNGNKNYENGEKDAHSLVTHGYGEMWVEEDEEFVTHEYGEMYSVFKEIPYAIEILRANVLQDFNKNPALKLILAKHPSLRPGTWKWKSPEPKKATRLEILRNEEHLDVILDVVSYTIEPAFEIFRLVE